MVNIKKMEQNAIPSPRLHRVLYTCFFLSGAAGLIYQVSWMKALGLSFGRTTHAMTAVLCSFMAGLALGSWLLGRYSERVHSPLRLYGWLELGIALTGFSSLGGIWLTRWLSIQVYDVLVDKPALLLGFRFLASFLVLLLPTTLMGGTYPVVVKYLTRRREQLGFFASRLYWLNTAGAITGASLAGFVLLWRLGLFYTLLVAAGLNLIAAALVLFSPDRFSPDKLSSVRLKEQKIAAPDRYDETQEEPVSYCPGVMILLVAGVSGFTAMMFEIGWTRVLAVFLSSTTYAFTIMLITFLSGITLGSYLFERWRRSWDINLKLLSYLFGLLSLGGLFFLVISTKLAELTLWLTRASGESGVALLVVQFLVSFLAMIVPATMFGLIFPTAVVLYCSGDRRLGAGTGRLYAVNTLGSILGAFITGLFLIQWLNTVNTLLLGVGLNVAVAFTLFAHVTARGDRATTKSPGAQLLPDKNSPKEAQFYGFLSQWNLRHATVGIVLLSALAGAAATKVFDHPLLLVRSIMAGAARNDFPSRLTMDEIVYGDKLVYIQEGVNATVSVTRHQGTVSLQTDGKTEGATRDHATELMLAYLPLSLHSRPLRVLVIGFGTGSTVYAATQFANVEQVDVVEIEPAVLSAAPYLEELNHGVYRHPKVRVILDDARNYLMATDQRYDVIISEPSYIWSSGISSLFTREFYKQVREHLNPEGLFMQWVHAYQMAPQDMSTIFNTLGAVFNQMTLWLGNLSNFLILASPEQRNFSLESLEKEYKRNPDLRADLARYLSMNEPAGLLGYYLLDDSPLRQLAAFGDLNTDDRTVLEYRMPFNIARKTTTINLLEVRSFRQEALPPFVDLDDKKAAVMAAAETQIQSGMLGHILGAPLVSEALRSTDESERALLLRARVAIKQKRYNEALKHLQRVSKQSPLNAEAEFMRGFSYLNLGQFQPARQALEKCLKLSPQHLKKQHLKTLHLKALRALVHLESRVGRRRRALELQKQVIASHPRRLYADWTRLSELHMTLGQTEQAINALKKSLKLEPLGYAAHRNMADYFARTGKNRKAIEEYQILIQYYPARNPENYLKMIELYRKTGSEGAAKKTLRKAKRIFPESYRVQRSF